MTNPLSTKAVLANVTIRRWTGRRLDKQVTDEVNQERGAEVDAGRYNKLLIPKKAFELVNEATRAGRHTHHVLTQPWMDEGSRILPTALYDKFATTFRELRSNFDKAADDFAKNYPMFIEPAAVKKRLGKMYKAEDFPDPKRVRHMFSFDVAILPCPDVADFRVSLSKEQLADTETLLKGALEEAMKEPFRRISHVVGRMTERLKAYKPADESKGKKAEGLFRDSLVTNIREVVELLPAFNLTGDKALADMIKRMEKELCTADAQVLREDDRVRKSVAKSAEAILKQAEALMS